MYQVTGADGKPYVAPDLATLQLWVDQNRVSPHMMVGDLRQGRHVPAGSIPGLHWPATNQSQMLSQTPYQAAANYPRYAGAHARPPWLLAILGTIASGIFCCLPIGVVSLIFCSMAGNALSSGDNAKAQSLLGTARTWGWVSLLAGLAGLTMALVFGAFTGGFP